MKYKAVIFDFDGVIKDSVSVKSNAFKQLYIDEGDSFVQRVEEYHLKNGGVSRYEKIRTWNEWLGRSKEDSVVESMGRQFSELAISDVVNSPYVHGAVESIKVASQHTLSFIATGTPDDEIKLILKELGIVNYFDEIFGSSMSKIGIVAEILKKYNLDKDEILFIGDSKTDYDAAEFYNIDFYLRLTHYNTALQDLALGFKFKSENLNELPDIIRNGFSTL